MESVVFYFFSGVSIVTALVVVASPRPIYAVLALVACFLSVAGLYGLLGATFLAAVQSIIYAGVVVVVFPIVIVLLHPTRVSSSGDDHGTLRWVGTLTGLILFGLLAIVFLEGETMPPPIPIEPVRGSLVAIGSLLVDGFAVSALGAAVVVLSAVVGAAWLARR